MAEALLSLPPSAIARTHEDPFESLCAAVRTHPPPDQHARVAAWNCSGFDWNRFLAFAEYHGVLALVAHNLTRCAPAVPAEVEALLRSAYAENLRRNLWFARELSCIVEHLAKNHVRVIPYKGPVLAQSAYGDLGLRSFSDLDLLICAADFERAKQALAELGFLPSQHLAPEVERLFLRTGYERSFDGAGAKNLIELQWAVLPHFYAIDFDAASLRIDDLFARAGRVRFGAVEVPCLSAEDCLLALCLHAAKHLWTRLIWIVDIAQTLRAPGIEFALVRQRAQAMRIERILSVSCWLAQKLLDEVIPSGAGEFEHDPVVKRIGAACADRMARATSYDLDSAGYFRQVWEMRERPRDRWRSVWRLVWTPGPGEIASIRLPETWFPLYRVVRIARLVRRLPHMLR